MRAPFPLLLLLVLPACAAARPEGAAPDATPKPSSPTPYGALGVMGSFEEFDLPPRMSARDSDVGVVLRGGLRLDEHFAVEATAEDAAGFRVRRPGSSADMDLVSLGVQGKYYFTADEIQPYALAGFGAARVDGHRFVDDEEGGYLRLGVGTDFYLRPDVALFGEASYNQMVGGVRDFDHFDFLVGLLVRF